MTNAEPITDSARLAEIEAADREVADAEDAWADAKEAAKIAKESFDGAVQHLRMTIRRHSPGDSPLFNEGDE